MNDLIYVGYISGPFGLKGQLKVLSDSNHIDKIFKIGNKIYIDNAEYIIKNYHLHKGHLITLEGYEDINKINNLLKKDIYISRENLNLDDGEYLYVELIGMKIIDEEKEIGVVEEILFNKNTIFIKSGNLIIPVIDKYFEKVDINSKIVYVKKSKELIL